MATIRAFGALRPTSALVSKVAALPYDVMNTEEARKIVEGNPYSFLHVDKPEMHVSNPVGDELYAFAGHRLNEMIQKGIFIKDEESLYIYGLSNQQTTQYGLVCLVSAKEYDEGIIKKHENTRTDKEIDRIKHVSYCHAHTGPIFLAYKELELVTAWLLEYTSKHEPVYYFTGEDNVKHQVFKISDPHTIHNIICAFEEADTLYIADGHHRAAAAASVARKYREEGKISEDAQYFLATIFPKEQLCIMDYNRVLKDESALDAEQLFECLQQKFQVEAIEEIVYKPIKRHTFGMRYQKKWYKLTIKEEWVDERDPVASLDASLLQTHVLEPLFNILDPKADKRIDFVGGIRGIEELNRRTDTDMDIAFSMFPTSIDELIQVADANQLMPPKSTWFEPKLRSGIFIHDIKD